MNNPELPFTEHSPERVQFLITQALQNTTIFWREAIRQEEAEGGYLQGFLLEAPEPTTAFRMDTKREFTTPEGPRRHKLYIHTPQNADPNKFLTRTWVKHVRPSGVDALYTMSHLEGVRVSSRMPLTEDEIIDLEGIDEYQQPAIQTALDNEIALMSSTEEDKKRTGMIIRLLRDYNAALISHLVVVKFYS
jgi:hypothetical protein